MPTYRLAAFLALTCSAQAAIAPVRASVQLRVVILAVNEFPDSSTFQDDDLDSKMLEAGKDLTAYFQQNFNVTPEFLHTRAQTDSEPLRRWLGEYFTTTQQTITLFFILTHGVGETTNANTAYNSELYLATTDASDDTITSKGLKARAELLSYFRSQPNGSTVFLFIDACNAARINSEGLKQDLNADPQHHVMILTSSQAVEKAYQARFTRTLQKLWEIPTTNCTHEDSSIEKLIDMSMDRYYPLATPSTMNQTVKVVRPFTKEFCIESFAADHALLVIGNTSRTTEMKVAYRQYGDTQESEWMTIPTNSIVSLTLLRKQYSLHMIAEDAQPSSDDPMVSVDFSSGNYAQFLPSSGSPDPLQFSTLAAHAVTVAEESGMPDNAVQMLRSSIDQDLTAAITERNDELAQRKRRSDELKSLARALAVDEQTVTVQEENERQAITKEVADLATCCRQNRGGLPIVDYTALQAAIRLTDQRKQNLAAIGERRGEITQRLTLTAVESAQAEVARVTTEDTLYRLRLRLQELVNTIRVGKQEAQQALASRIDQIGEDAVRTERGIVFSLDRSGIGPGGEIPAGTQASLATIAETLRTAYPGTFVEVEAYDSGGDQDAAKLRADAVARELAQTLGDSATIVARGFGRVPVVDQDSNIGQVVPTTVQVTLSGTRLGY